jgi:hypothetical protein
MGYLTLRDDDVGLADRAVDGRLCKGLLFSARLEDVHVGTCIVTKTTERIPMAGVYAMHALYSTCS